MPNHYRGTSFVHFPEEFSSNSGFGGRPVVGSSRKTIDERVGETVKFRRHPTWKPAGNREIARLVGSVEYLALFSVSPIKSLSVLIDP